MIIVSIYIDIRDALSISNHEVSPRRGNHSCWSLSEKNAGYPRRANSDSQHLVRGTPRITGLAPVRVIDLKRNRTGSFSR